MTEQNTLNEIKSLLERQQDMLFHQQVPQGIDVPTAGD